MIRLPGNIKVDQEHITVLQSCSNYTQIYTTQNDHVITVALSLCHTTKSLNQKQFVRVNRSTVVNTSFVKTIECRDDFLKITLLDGTSIHVSRRRKESVLNLLKSAFNGYSYAI